MKKIFVILLCFFLTGSAFGEIISFEGGLVGDPTLSSGIYNYQEVIFITGEPIVLTGTVKIPVIPTDKDSYSLTYDYTLSNSDKNATVTRKVTFNVTKVEKKKYSQTTYKYELTKLDEKINIDAKEYILDSYLYTRSMIYDNTPAVDYFSGNVYLKRTYFIDGTPISNLGKVVIEITSNEDEGAMIGYNHLWGDAETYIAKMSIVGKYPNPDYDENIANSEKNLTWRGDVDLRASVQKFSSFKYQNTAPQSMSFSGSYVRVDKLENIFQYTYNLPKIEDGVFSLTLRSDGEESLRNDSIVDGSSMIIPKMRDIGGHWSEDNIFLLASLEITNNDSEFYSPDQPLTRIEFAQMLSSAIATIEERSKTDIIRSLRPGATTMFNDIPNDYEFYNYVTFVYNEGIMIGDGNYFYPEDKVSRAEVITIMINSLGLENRAPALPFETRYDDDSKIPNWAKRFIYMADEINLVTGFPDNTIKPSDYVTRAEGASMIVNLINHMKDNVRIDFREKIINRY